MLKKFKTTETKIRKTGFPLTPDVDICQTDYPLDWYQEEFIPYAEEYLALPDRKPGTIINWMQKYIEPALKHFGDKLLLLAHYYMGGEIVKLVETFGGRVGDSYELALMVANHPEKKLIVESAVHFMAESIAILSNPDQTVYITNPKAGCTMEMMAKDFMVEPALNDLNAKYGKENILPVCYMNTSGRIKALTGEQGGAVCTSSNVKKIVAWALRQNKKILFIPDRYMGENVAGWLGIKNLAYWPGGEEGVGYSLFSQDAKTLKQFDDAKLILFAGYCAVHTYFEPEMVDYWHDKGYTVLVHPECKKTVTDKADGCGSTAYLWDYVFNDKFGTKKYAVGTERHMVDNLKQASQTKSIEVVNLGAAPLGQFKGMGCGCATMSRNDPPHLVAILDLLRQDKAPDYNQVQAGDIVNEYTGTRTRLDQAGQKWVTANAKIALENMIKITEGFPSPSGRGD
jgi:quinolinate synthase